MPTLPRVYADFNAIEYDRGGPYYARLPLTGYGTLASLAKQRLRLSEGLELVLFEPNDIECTARAHYEPSRKGPAGILGEWVALIPQNDFCDSMEGSEFVYEHPCFGCGVDLQKNQPPRWRSYHEVCSECGTPVMAPVAPPESAA
jgi:hypothetical protein